MFWILWFCVKLRVGVGWDGWVGFRVLDAGWLGLGFAFVFGV